MPRIADHFLNSVVYLYASVEEADAAGVVGGTGFLVSVPGPRAGSVRIYIATNSHVAIGARAVRFNMRDGSTRAVAIDENDWHHHLGGDDVAVCSPTWSHDYEHRVLPREFFFTDEELASINFGAGDDVFFMGRFAHHAGRARNRPVVRFGTVALIGAEPVRQTGRDFLQDSILIDGRSAGGFSGSPVLWRCVAPTRRTRGRAGSRAPPTTG